MSFTMTDFSLASGLGLASSFGSVQTIVATLLVAAVYRPLPKWSPIHGWELRINWRVPSLAAISRFLLFAGPICFVLLTKVVMYSERSPLQNSQEIIN